MANYQPFLIGLVPSEILKNGAEKVMVLDNQLKDE